MTESPAILNSELSGPVLAIAPPPFIVEPYLISGGCTFLYGPAKSGRTSVALSLAVSVDAGISHVFTVRQRVPVLYLNTERPKELMAARIAAVNAALGLAEERPLLIRNWRGRPLAEMLPAVTETIEAEGVGLVIVDSVAMAGYGSLSDGGAASRLIADLNSLDVAWLGVAAASRGGGHIYGSVVQESAADVLVELRGQAKGLANIELTVRGASAMPAHWTELFNLHFDSARVQRVSAMVASA